MGLWNLITDSNGFLTSGFFFNDQTPDTKHLILKKKNSGGNFVTKSN